MSARFEGQVAIVTGGTGGIGSAVVRRLLRDGARVAIVDRVAPKQIEHEAACFIQADVTQEVDVRRYVEQTMERFGKLDLLFNNAGIEGRVAPIVETTVEDFDRVQAVNVRGVFLGLREALRALQRQGSGGAIVNTASIAGLRGGAGVAPYITSKHAVIGLTRTAAQEAASFGVRVNAVAPGYIRTRMLEALADARQPGHAEEALQAMATRVPMQRLGSPDEVANVVCWLLSSDSSYVTGAVHVVDAGLTS